MEEVLIYRFIIGLLIVIFGNVLYTKSSYNVWIKLGVLTPPLKKWKGTKKLCMWFLCWNIVVWLNLIIYLVISFYSFTYIGMDMAFSAYILYWPIIGFIYCVIKYQIRYYQEKKEDKAHKNKE